jgi:adenosylmethionine-8-amino-7-oxononanoate aminotransferase
VTAAPAPAHRAPRAYIAHTDPLVIARSEGPYLFDLDGTSYLDAKGSWWVTPLGHRHPRLVRALVEQAGRLPHGHGLHKNILIR